MSTYLSAESPIDERALPTIASVKAQWLQNAGAGLGAIAVVIALRMLWHTITISTGLTTSEFPADWPLTAAIAAGLGLLLFGLLMVLRNSLDELIEAGEWSALNGELEQMTQTNATLNETIDALRHQLADTKAELSQQLSHRTAHAFIPATPVADAGHQLPDARTLAERIYRGQAWDRSTMQAAGWTQAKWAAAKDALLTAGVIAYAGRNPQRRLNTWAEATAALDVYALRLQKASLAASLAMTNDATPEVATTNHDQEGRG